MWKTVAENERKELSIWAFVRLVDTHFEVAKVVRIRYFARGWYIEGTPFCPEGRGGFFIY